MTEPDNAEDEDFTELWLEVLRNVIDKVPL